MAMLCHGFHVRVSCFMRIKCILIVAFEAVERERGRDRDRESERERERYRYQIFSRSASLDDYVVAFIVFGQFHNVVQHLQHGN